MSTELGTQAVEQPESKQSDTDFSLPGHGVAVKPLVDRAVPTALVGTPSGLKMRASYVVADLASLAVGLLTAMLATSWISGTFWRGLTSGELQLLGLFVPVMLATSARSGSYLAVLPRPARQFRAWTYGMALVLAGLLLTSWVFQLGVLQVTPFLVVLTAVSHLTACFLRAYCRIKLGTKDWWGTRVLIVGAGKVAQEAIRFLHKEPQWGLRPVGFLAEESADVNSGLPVPYLGSIDELGDVTQKTGVQRGLVILHPDELAEMRSHFYKPNSGIRHWIVVPNANYFNMLWSEWGEAARMPAVMVSNSLAMKRALLLKRLIDLVICSAATVVLLPMVAIIGGLIKLTSTGPIFFSHRRVGKSGLPFQAWKFRTMVQNADVVLQEYLDSDPQIRQEWEEHQKIKNDPRITSIGRFLRATSLDELPQLWNVLKGEMSLVGPRPVVAAEAEKYETLFDHYRQVVPGITGLWQVSGRNDTTYEERVDLDVYYVENWSPWLDLYILACTVKVVLLREGAY